MDISIDSRTIQKGQYFIPVKGKNYDGRDFIKEAVSKGGILLDVDLQKYTKSYRKKLSATVIAVTGSVGKTTCCQMLYSLLRPYFNTVCTTGNQNNDIGVPLTILRADFQTEILILELGIRQKSDMLPLVQVCRPSLSIVTGISYCHMAFYRSLKQLALAKSTIFQKPLSWEQLNRTALIPSDNVFFDVLSEKAQRAEYKVRAFHGDSPRAAMLDLCYQVGRYFSLDESQITQGLSNFISLEQRLKKITLSKCTLYDDTYNANPASVLYALDVLKPLSSRKLFVLGDMLELGSFTDLAYSQMYLPMIDADISLFISCGNIVPKVPDTISSLHFHHKDLLHAYLKDEIIPGDTILIKGSRLSRMEDTVSYLKTHVS
ncbi:MAG: Mur ligase family protein [bacterium]